MPQPNLDVVLLGPAPPYRGGIADTQWQFAQALQKQNKKVALWTFTQLYPEVLFPGKTQFSEEKVDSSIDIERKIHAYHPWEWKKVARALNAVAPKAVVFRYWTPFLSPCWTSIAQHLSPSIKCIALVDNWKAHEPKPWDQWLNKRFSKKMHAFSCLSTAVQEEISAATEKACWGKMHPIANNLPPKLEQAAARKKLKLELEQDYLLFFGLIRPYKGLDLLLKAMEKQPDKKLLIVGECYEKPEKYERIIRELKLEKRVDFQNRFVSAEEASVYFSAADALILPYKSATQSGVIAMAYHYALPMVVTHHQGLAQPIEEDQTGEVCAPTPTSISTSISALFTVPRLKDCKHNLVQNQNNYSWDNYAQAWINFVWND